VSEPTFRLVTSFSDLRYYLECPHDYYLRKVLGFAPTIDQAFGYGRAVHNLMREVHREPARWAELAADRAALEAEIHRLTHEGPFYLRYTTGVPLDNMRAKATAIASDYVLRYREELAGLTFEPEREFETLIEEVQVLVSGAIDLIRRDDPPMVTLIDFKSGDPDSDAAQKLDEEEMRLQISIYGLAARRELEYLPDQGLVRYLDTKAGDGNSELAIPLDEESLAAARATVVQAVGGIQQRHWNQGPARPARRDPSRSRCHECDFGHICGRPGAAGQAVRAGGRGRRPARAAPR
jgi:DNA helicase-2/ATP-dependent DNA helicase PcrA